jgi:hypothetical protein
VTISSTAPLSDDLLVGFAAGHTFGGVVDVKGEILTTDVYLFEHSISGGLGVGVHF